MEATGHDIDDIINEPVAGFRVLHSYKLNRFVNHYLQAKEREAIARQEMERWIVHL
jgi:hypothetical protein